MDADRGTQVRAPWLPIDLVVDVGAVMVLVLAGVVGFTRVRSGRFELRVVERERAAMESPEWPSEEQLTGCFTATRETARRRGSLDLPEGETWRHLSVVGTWHLVAPRVIRLPDTGRVLARPEDEMTIGPGVDSDLVSVPFPAEFADPPAPRYWLTVDTTLLARIAGESERGSYVYLRVTGFGGIDLGISVRPDGSVVVIGDCPLGVEHLHGWLDSVVRPGSASTSREAVDRLRDPAWAKQAQEDADAYVTAGRQDG